MKETTYDDNARIAYLSSGSIMRNIHTSENCFLEYCPIHNPSDHDLRHLPLNWVNGIFIRLSNEYENGFTVDPDDYLYNNVETLIFQNSAFCRECNQEVISVHRHDYRSCSGGHIAVDGGQSYLRLVALEGAEWDNTSITFTKGS